MDTLEDPDGAYYLALPKGTRLFEYRIESVLGQGGFGITYLANDTLLDESVAIKEYFPNESAFRTRDLSARAKSPQDREIFQSGLEAFLGEARIIARFRHRNIMQVRRFFEANGTAYIVLQFETGRSFEDVVADGAIPEKELMPIFAGILDGLEAVHERAILHRDIKPRNVIIRQDGTPVLIDFGAARDFSSRNSATVTKMASPGYSPPEQYGIGSQQGPWSDFYALGAMMYRAVTGKVPFDSLRRLRNDPLEPASTAAAKSYNKALLRVIDHMMRIDESERPATVADITAALAPMWPPFAARLKVEKLLQKTKQLATPQAEAPEAPKRDRTTRVLANPTPGSSRRPLWIGGGVAGVLAIVGGAVLFLQSGAPKHEAAAPTGETLVPVVKPAPPPVRSPETNEAAAVKPEEPAAPPADTKPAQEAVKTEAAKTDVDLTPGRVFRDCATCPEMTIVPAGQFTMGSNEGFPNEAPAHETSIAAPFAMSRKTVTFAEWDACVADGGCTHTPNDQGWGRDLRPVVNVSWLDAKTYVAWLSKTTGKTYRLPTEAEWEYAARAGSTTAYFWGPEAGQGHANCADCVSPRPTQTQPVGTYPANAFGLFDMAGNVAEWVSDCWRTSYANVVRLPPAALHLEEETDDACDQRVLRGGSFRSDARYIRSAARVRQAATAITPFNGFRVVSDPSSKP